MGEDSISMPNQSVRDVWEEALGRLRKQMSAAAYNTWLTGTSGVSLAHDELTVSVPDEYTQHWIQGSLLPIMERTASDVLKRPVAVVLQVAADAPQAQPVEPAGAGQAAAQEPAVERPARSGSSFIIGARPDPQLTFDRFVVGENTKLAYAAATKVANDHGGDYNPLVLYASAPRDSQRGAGAGAHHPSRNIRAVCPRLRHVRPEEDHGRVQGALPFPGHSHD